MNVYSQFIKDDRFVIFLLHGVISRQAHRIRNYTKKHLQRDRFVSILRDLCTHGIPVSMSDIVGATHGELVLPERSFVLTFDDGFENNYSVVAPILEEFNVPATFYITTDFIESNRPSWIDMIEYAVETRRKFELKLPTIGIDGRYETEKEIFFLLDEIRRLVKSNAKLDPYEVANEVWAQLRVKKFTPDPGLDQKMHWDQVRELNQNKLFTIGGHSHTHQILEYLTQPELEKEVGISMNKLEEQLGCLVKHYSYPEGLENCYSDRVINVLKQHGIICAPSAIHGGNCIGDDLFHLKRIMIV
mgnify:CR=1 FL=1